MIAQKHQKPIKHQLKIELKLPEIHSRKNIQSAKKNQPPIQHLPQINNPANHKNIVINKENHSLNLIPRRNSFTQQIKARLFQVEAAEKIVKNVLGGPEATINIGGDMTNFQMKVEANKDYLRRQRKKSHFGQHNPNIPQEKKQENIISPKNKSVSSKDQFSIGMKIKQQMKLNIQQNHEVQTARQVKREKKAQNQQVNIRRFKSERKPIDHEKHQQDQNSQVFQSIKEILSNPQKNLDVEAKKVKRLVKFTIEELENRLKRMNEVEGNKSYFEGSENKEDKNFFDRKLNSAKSVGMIPISPLPIVDELTQKNWNRIDLSSKENEKAIQYHKSNFYNQVDHIQKLQMKSYKSIEKMVENRKLLIDLQLIKKSQHSLMLSDKKQKEISA